MAAAWPCRGEPRGGRGAAGRQGSMGIFSRPALMDRSRRARRSRQTYGPTSGEGSRASRASRFSLSAAGRQQGRHACSPSARPGLAAVSLTRVRHGWIRDSDNPSPAHSTAGRLASCVVERGSRRRPLSVPFSLRAHVALRARSPVELLGRHSVTDPSPSNAGTGLGVGRESAYSRRVWAGSGP